MTNSLQFNHGTTLRASTIAVMITAALAAAGVLPALNGHTTHFTTTSAEGMPQSPLALACADSNTTVAGATELERHLACAGAFDAIQQLAACRIAGEKPIHIRMAQAVRNPFGNAVFGTFDAARDETLVTRLSAVAPMVRDTPYEHLQGRSFYRSLIVHEVVHGIMHQRYTRQPATRAAMEYPAYALQIASLPAPVRDTFLSFASDPAEHRVHPFNDVVLGFDPYFFAAQAYHHFAASADRCARLHALLDDRADFIDQLP